jgi:bacterioferritin
MVRRQAWLADGPSAGPEPQISFSGDGRRTLVEGVAQCEAAQDYVSREVLVEILSDTEEHIDFLETQLSLLRQLGEQNYLQSAMGELED